jgi:hypothetical protein
MLSYVKEAIELIEQAFEPPEYFGARSRSRLKILDGRELLSRSYNILQEGRTTRGEDALSRFYLAVIGRHLGKEERDYVSYLQAALAHDPAFLEARIALRDGKDYFDPFCYPKWEDLRDGKATFRPTILHSAGPNTCLIDLVRDAGLIIPAVVVKHQRHLFRRPLTSEPAALVLVNVEAVIPTMPALMHIVPVVFDDEGDPFWCANYLNLFPIKTREIFGVPVIPFDDYRPLLGRDMARRFCQYPCRCVLFILDENNGLLMTRLIKFDETDSKRLQGYDRVLEALGDKEIGYLEWKSSQEIHNQCFSRQVLGPQGQDLLIPKGRDPGPGSKIVHQVVARGEKLMLSGTDKVVAQYSTGRKNDVFISHSHADHAWMLNIKEWLERIWPSIRVFHTDSDEQKFRKDPLFFHAELLRSRCVIFLATPRSIDRPWVEAELGAAATNNPIICFRAGGITSERLKRRHDKDLYSKLDLGKMAGTDQAFGWRRLARLIATELELEVPWILPRAPKLLPGEIQDDVVDDPTGNFLEDLFGKIISRQGQTESQAELLLEQVEREFAQKAGGPGAQFLRSLRTLNLSPRKRLFCMLMSVSDEAGVNQIVDNFPALIDGRMLRETQHFSDLIHNLEPEMYKQSQWVLEILTKRVL